MAENREEGAPSTSTHRSYTRSRRLQLLLGKFQGLRLPFMVSVPQVVVFTASLALMLSTRKLWSPIVGGGASDLMAVVGVPGGLAFAVRYLRIEGRSPLQMALGLTTYATRRSVGPENNGKPTRRYRRCNVATPRLYVTDELPSIDREAA